MSIFNKTFSSLLHGHAFGFGVFVTLFTFFFFAGGLVVANGQTLTPSDSHLVDLYVDGQQTTLPTRAATVGDFISKAGITMHDGDIVEPVATTPIDADNFRVQVYRAHPITIIDGATVKRVLTAQTSAPLIAKEAGFSTYPEDILTITTADNFVQDQIFGEKLIINRATPVSISLYGAPAVTYRTHATTVNDLLKEKGIVPEQGATVSPDASSTISENMAIFISKFGKTVITTEEDVPFETESSTDPTKEIGTTTVITKGVLGKKQVVYELQLQDGREIGRTKIQEVVTSQPQTQVQTKGTKTPTVVAGDRIEWMKAAGIAESDFFYVDYIVGREGGWNGTTKYNRAGSGAYGLCQALPGSKMASAGADWATNPVTQLKWCSGYATGRYGSWAGAYQAWLRQNWW
ncbi:MAG: G5 domain-containing protein [Candidatus Saccharimonadales bacterium]